jgi:hypothetical protein
MQNGDEESRAQGPHLPEYPPRGGWRTLLESWVSRQRQLRARVSAQAQEPKTSLIDPSPIRLTSHPKHLSDLRPLYEINERCVELLVSAARTDCPTLPLVCYLRELLCSAMPDTLARAAHRPLLLIDMQLTNGELWRAATDRPVRPTPRSACHGAFPRPAAVQLARWTLSFAWHKVRAAPHELCLLGISTDVARAIAQLPITEIAPVAERYCRYVRPRWEDRPAVWRRLLLSAQSEDIRRTRDANLYGIQLLTAELLAPVGRSRSAS